MERYFNQVTVDLSALTHNLGQVRQLIGPSVRIMAMVKADAYGHGLIEVGGHLAKSGADILGVMDLQEAVILREAGVQSPIAIVAGLAPDQCREVIDYDLIPFIYDLDLVWAMEAIGRRRGKKAAIILKIDTGMHRLGVFFDVAEKFLEEITNREFLKVVGFATHLAEADDEDSEFTSEQIDRLARLIDHADRTGLHLTLNSAANSAAVLGLPRAHFQMVRPGIMLYGYYPADYLRPKADLRPVMSLTSRVIQIKRVALGEAVSYGLTWTAKRETLVAVAPIGYAQGLNRLLSNKGWGLIRGHRAPIRGRVCMNLTMFDVTDIPGVAVGDEVVLIGSQGLETVSAEALAYLTGSISYEILCQVGKSNHRRYV
ncbi:MAG: alanine racemase [Deltaproteobacteria bacterium]|nr:alanine racemase [Deltaproteobacteria bacterium]